MSLPQKALMLLPPEEATTLAQAYLEAAELAEAGRVTDGRARLLAGLRRAEGLPPGPEGMDLASAYLQALAFYEQRFGSAEA